MIEDNDQIAIAVTGLAWMGNGICSINSILEEALQKATAEVQVVAYQITAGSGNFLDLLNACLSRGLRVSMIINRFDKQPKGIKTRLVKILNQFQHFYLFDFCPENKESLHAKVIVIDRSKALVGSSNITRNGLVLNHELGVIIEGPTATRISSLIDTLERDNRIKQIKS